MFHGYAIGMKTAISILDEIFKKAERLARRLGISRSQLYAHAVEDYVKAIYKLSITNKKVTPTMVAEDLGVTQAAVTKMVHRLKELKSLRSTLRETLERLDLAPPQKTGCRCAVIESA